LLTTPVGPVRCRFVAEYPGCANTLIAGESARRRRRSSSIAKIALASFERW
jgi:hypothetical protein